ncbi:histidine triad (HIT) family protein [Desulfovibrionales bacterium]
MVSVDCIFCKIVTGIIPCARIFEIDTILAFMDIAFVQPGHALVIPKGHYPTLLDLPTGLGIDLLAAQQTVARAVQIVTHADGFNLNMNNFEAAGQLVPHAHFHIIPRHLGDGFKPWTQTPYSSPDTMHILAAAIRNAIV